MATFLEKLSLNELSLVDKGANQHASVTIFKRAPETNETVSKIAKNYGAFAVEANTDRARTFNEILGGEEKNRKLWQARDELYPLFNALQTSIGSIVTDKDLSDSSRNEKIETSVNDFLSAVREKMPEVEAELTKALIDYTAGSSGPTPANHKDIQMADAKTVEELQKSLETLQKSFEDQRVELEKAESLAKMSDAAKAYMKSLDDEGKAKFMALSAEDKEKKAAAVSKSDETLELHGQTIAKSAVGDGVFAVMKAQAVEIAKANERIEKAEREAEIQVLAKRADDELSALPGDRLAKARILKASDTLSAEDKTAFDAMMKAANSSLAKAFTTVGKSNGAEIVEGSAEDKLQKKAEEIAKRDNVSVAKAYSTAVSENPGLYDEIEAARAGE